MTEGNGTKGSDSLSWRRPHQAKQPPQLVPMQKPEPTGQTRQPIKNAPAWKDKDNWRVKVAPPPENATRTSNHPQQHISSFGRDAGHNKVPNGRVNNLSSTNGPRHLAVPTIGRLKANVMPSTTAQGTAASTEHHGPLVIKPSTMGNGVIGRTSEFSTSPRLGKSPPLASATWGAPEQSLRPATNLTSLKIGGFHPRDSQGPSLSQLQASLSSKDRDENWMLTPTSSLPSLPGTPHRQRDRSTERDLAQPLNSTDSRATRSSPSKHMGGPPRINTPNGSPSLRNHVDQFQSSLHQSARTPSPNVAAGGSVLGSSLLGRSLGPQIHASPKRSPLSIANRSVTRGTVHAPPAYQYGPNTTSSNALSPASSPKLLNRALSPAGRLPSIDTESIIGEQRGQASIASVLSPGPTSQRMSLASRRESFNSVTSGHGGHTLSRSRRSSQVISPHSPTGAFPRVGVYRPPHLRNRGSFSGLLPAVAHYDRVRTPSLRGQSRSRESSVSLSRPGSRPPSAVPFYRSDTIPEHGTPDSNHFAQRGRISSLSSFAGSVLDEPPAVGPSPLRALPEGGYLNALPSEQFLRDRHEAAMTLDGASLVAKLEQQTSLNHDAEVSGNDYVLDEEDEQSEVYFDMSADDMIDYGASDGYPLSRHGSALSGNQLGDVFEIGDRVGPGLEHDGHVIQIAETTPGFDDQNADLTGTQLEVIRKLGEGSYAVVYLVREVTPDDDAHDADLTLDEDDHPEGISTRIGRQNSRPRMNGDRSYGDAEASIRADDDGDLTMIVDSEDLLSSTLKAKVSTGQEGTYASPSLEQRRRKDIQSRSSAGAPPREFALKCLCKRDLPEDMLEVQRLEATIHQAIPAHPNIVTLYRTYETPDWLFLILEYCPGQDLYYWLEQAQDTNESGAPNDQGAADGDGSTRRYDRRTLSPGMSEDNDDDAAGLSSSFDATPPSPSILASTGCMTLLSRRRVRLVARMFRQICDAVQFCHDRGISHRDIKPENFIVEDKRYEESVFVNGDHSFVTSADSMRDMEGRVIVKMTDFGLATAEDRCEDFDCGSKPYMAFGKSWLLRLRRRMLLTCSFRLSECHNNVSASYDPKQADIWSLGVVLLNLLFHRSPFTEPSNECPSFNAYCYDPIRFLMESFDGLTETVARFLSENVFCSVSDDPVQPRKRITAGDFSRWAFGLVEHLELSGPGPGRISRGASMQATTPLIHSRTASMSTLPSLMSSPRARARSLARDSQYGGSDYYDQDGPIRTLYFSSRPGSISPNPMVFTPDVLPSPRFTPSPRPMEKNPFEAQYMLSNSRQPSPNQIGTSKDADTSAHQDKSTSDRSDAVEGSQSPVADPDESLDRAEVDALLQLDSDRSASNDVEAVRSDDATDVQGVAADEETSKTPSPEGLEEVSEISRKANLQEDTDGVAGNEGPAAPTDQSADREEIDGEDEKAPSVTNSNHSKRRKRGARKGRTLAKHLKRSQSVENLSELGKVDPEAKAKEREATIRELALASQTLARQMSQLKGKNTGASSGADVETVSLSPPLAAAAARFTLENLSNSSKAQDAAEDPVVSRAITPLQLDASTEGSSTNGEKHPASDGASSNWASSALRRERINERKSGAVSLLQDSGRVRPVSWRERNQSTATFSSLASNTTMSSFSSASSETSSIYSTSSAPAAMTKRDPSLRSRTRGAGLLSVASGLDTISERKKEVDASYLAGIFGGDEARASEKRRKEAASAKSGQKLVPEKEKKKLLTLLQDSDKPSGKREATAATSKSNGLSEATPGSTSVSTSFVSRFRRPGSSSSSKSNGNSSSTGQGCSGMLGFNSSSGTVSVSSLSPSPASTSMTGKVGTLRDASTSTSSLTGNDNAAASAVAAEESTSLDLATRSEEATKAGKTPMEAAAPAAGLVEPVPVAAGAGKAVSRTVGEPAPATKKRGMGKFFSGMRDSIMNR